MKMVASWSKASSLSAGIAANGLAGDGFGRIVVRSCAAAMARSVEGGVSITVEEEVLEEYAFCFLERVAM